MPVDRTALMQRFASDFLGLDTEDLVAATAGTIAATNPRKRIYLDSAATCLMPRPVLQAIERYLQIACANSHTHATTAGIATTIALHRGHELVGELVGSDPATDCVILTGAGATGAMNLLAQALMRQPERPIAVVSAQEHHSNLLPWMRQAGAENVRFAPALPDGKIDIATLDRILRADAGRIRVLAATALSNVTGVINPLRDLARRAHAVGAELVVDGAQAGAHVPISMHPSADRAEDIDYIALSGHKLYAPGSPGVLVGKKAAFEKCGWSIGQCGGGTREYVGTDKVLFKAGAAERQEAGTPNVPGTIGLGVAVGILQAIGLDAIREHERQLMAYALPRLLAVPEVVIYGPMDSNERAAVITFNLGSIHHGLVAAALNDYFAIAVRNDCFCAQPYVRSQIFSSCDVRGYCDAAQLKNRGMVRASLGIYTTVDDIDALISALTWIEQNQGWLRSQYTDDGKGNFSHKTFRRQMPFSVDGEISQYVSQVQSGLLRPAGSLPEPGNSAGFWAAAGLLAIGGAAWYAANGRWIRT